MATHYLLRHILKKKKVYLLNFFPYHCDLFKLKKKCVTVQNNIFLEGLNVPTYTYMDYCDYY